MLFYDVPVEEFARIAGEEISPRTEEDVMTMAERLREESKLEGRLEGQHKEKIEIAKRLLANGTEPAFVAKITELSLDQIKSLQKITTN